jgi:transposase-like protein
MRRKQRSSHEKLQIVLESFKTKETVSELCNRHGITQSQYYRWREQLLKGSDKIFTIDRDKHVDKLQKENTKLKTLIGDLTVELKKTELELGLL